MYLHDPATRAPLLSAEEEAELARAAWNGDIAARHRIVECNIGFALKLARKYQRRHPHLWDDLEGEALTELVRASLNFDPSYATRFTTYAERRVRRACRHYVFRYRTTISVPIRLVDGSDTANPELARQARRIRSARNWGVNDDLDPLVGRKGERPDEAAVRRELIALVVAETDRTTEGAILRAYYGLDGAEEENTPQLGRRLGVTGSRIQQRRAKGVDQLKARLERRGVTA